MSRLLGSVRRPWMVALFAVLAATIAIFSQSPMSSQAVQAPTLISAPAVGNSEVSFNMAESKTVTVTAGSWTDSPTSVTYQWYRCTSTRTASSTDPTNCQLITGDTGTSHVNTASDVGFYILVKETATNAQGSSYTYSGTTTQVRRSHPFATAYPSMCHIRAGNVYCAGGGGTTYSNGSLWANTGTGYLGKDWTTWQGPLSTYDGEKLTDVISLEGSRSDMCALTLNGSIYCTGMNYNYSLADGGGINGQRQWFTRMKSAAGTYVTGAVDIAVGDANVCFSKTDGSVWCTGNGAYGATATGLSTSTPYPRQVLTAAATPLTGAIQVLGSAQGTTYASSFCAITTDGTTVGGKLYCWGVNTSALLGLGDTVSKNYAMPITVNSSTTGFTTLATGDNHTCAIQNTGVWCWGLNTSGELGTGTTAASVTVPGTPANTAGGVSFASGFVGVSVADGNASSCFVKLGGAVYCTGINTGATLNLGDATSTTTAKPSVNWTSGVNQVEMTNQFSCAFNQSSNQISCSGTNNGRGAWGLGNLNGSLTTSATVLTNITGLIGPNSVAPAAVTTTLNGNSNPGDTLSDTSTWTGFPKASLSYQWYQCSSAVAASSSVPGSCSAISGATSSTYTVQAGDIGSYVSAFVTATNSSGTTSTMLTQTNPVGSLPTTSVAPVLTAATTSAGLIHGTQLTLTDPTWGTANPTGTVSYAWYRCGNSGTAITSSTIPADCSVISGATAATYNISKSEFGFFIRGAQTYSSTAGITYALSATSAQVRPSTVISASTTSMCALRYGKIYCWGGDTNGNDGRSAGAAASKMFNPTPTPVVNSDGSEMTDVVQFSNGITQSCAIKVNRSMWCWGQQVGGAIGTGVTTPNFAQAAKVSTNDGNWVMVATAGQATFGATCAIDTSGAVWCSATNTTFGMAGDNASASSTFKKSTTLTSGFIQIFGSYDTNVSFCALKNTGAVYCWGNNNAGEVGDGSSTAQALATTPVYLESGVTTIDMNIGGSCAIKRGALWCWGNNDSSEFGTAAVGYNYSPFQPWAPNADADISNGLVSVSVTHYYGTGNGHACVVKYSGAVYCSGMNTDGSHNINNTTATTAFTATRWTSGVTDLGLNNSNNAGYSVSCAVKSQGVYCAGGNGQINLALGDVTLKPYVVATGPIVSPTLQNGVGVLDVAPTSTTVTTSQNFAPGQLVTSSLSRYDSVPAAAVAYKWYSCTNPGIAANSVPVDCSEISGATSSSYAVQVGDNGSYLRLRATLSNSLGTFDSISAAGLVGTAPTVASAPTGTISTGALTLLTGATLTAPAAPTFSGSPSPSASTQWYHCYQASGTWVTSLPTGCYPTEGGTSSTYVTNHSDDGFFMLVAYSGSNSAGNLTYYSPTTARVIYSNKIAMSGSGAVCVIKLGQVYCWGHQNANSGVLGSATVLQSTDNVIWTAAGDIRRFPTSPIKLASGLPLSDVISVSMGKDHACAVTYQGGLYCWGINSGGQLGDGTTVARYAAAPVLSAANTPVTGVTQVAASINNTCAIINNALVCWGATTTFILSATKTYATGTVTNLTTNVQQVAMGDSHVCAISNASARCFGLGSSGSLGDGSSTNNPTPSVNPISGELNGQTVSMSGGVTNITVGQSTTCAVKLGRAYCWGGNTLPLNLGITGTLSQWGNVIPVPDAAGGLTKFDSGVIAVNSGIGNGSVTPTTCATKLNGAVFCTGKPDNGAGSGSSGVDVSIPTATVLTSGVTEMAVGGYETCGIKSNQVYCAGNNGATNTYSNTLLDNSSVVKIPHQLVAAASTDLGVAEQLPSGTSTITGYAAVGNSLTATYSNFQNSGAWQGMPVPAMTQQWYLCSGAGDSTATLPTDCTAISGATASTTSVIADQTGKYLRVSVTGTNSVGAATMYSAALGPVGPAPTLTTAATLNAASSPTLNSLSSISANVAVFGGATAPITTTGQWYRCLTSGLVATSVPSDCLAIAKATSLSYLLTKNDIGAYLRYASIGTAATGQVISLTASTAKVQEGSTVASTYTATCSVKLGRVYCWGKNSSYQLGTGAAVGASVTSSSAATPVKKDANTILENVVDIQGHDSIMCAIDTSGALYCWGNTTNARLGSGVTSGNSSYAVTPVNASDGTSFSSGVVGVSISTLVVCAWKTSGIAYCWGTNTSGGLGNGSATTTVASTPVPVSNLASVSMVSVGPGDTCAISSGAVYCWGSNNAGGALDGTNTNTYSLTPTARSVLTSNVTSIAETTAATCAVMNYGVYCWGMNTSGQLGMGSSMTLAGSILTGAIAQVGASASDVAGIYSSDNGYLFCAIKTDQTLYCWGPASDGSIPGIQKLAASGYYTAPTLSSISGVRHISMEIFTAPWNFCMQTSGGLTCTGNNANSQLGDGTTTYATTSTVGAIPPTVSPAGFSTKLGADFVAPTLTNAPTITGTLGLFVGSTLTAPTAAATGFPTPTVTQKWVRCTVAGSATASVPTDCVDIVGATSATYTVTSADAGYLIRSVFSTSNSVASQISYSAAAGPVSSVTVSNFARPSGSADGLVAGETLTRTSAVWKSFPSVGAITGGWVRCGNPITTALTNLAAMPSQCAVIAGVTGKTYTLTQFDVGHYIAAYETATNAAGTYFAISPTSAFVIGQLNTVAVSATSTCAIKAGSVYCSGSNASGQLGNNSTTNPPSPYTPVQVLKSTTAGDYLTNVVSINAAKTGSDTFCAITSSAQLWCWGWDATTSKWLSTAGTIQKVAVQPLGSMKVAAVGMNTVNICAITEGATGGLGGALYCWGPESSYGSLGDGGSGVTKDPSNKVLAIASGVSAYDPGDIDQCAVVRGALYCWGGYWSTNKTMPNGVQSLLPSVMTGFTTGVTSVALGGSNGCAVQSGAVYCWGYNNAGQRGNGTTTSNYTPGIPSNAADGTSFASGVANIFSSADNTSNTSSSDRFCALMNSGALYCWGNDASVGLTLTSTTGTTTVTTPKAAVNLGSGVTSVGMGAGSSCAVKSGTVYCSGLSQSTNFGRNLGLTAGQYYTPTAVPNFTNPLFTKALSITPLLPAAASVANPVNVDTGVVSGYGSPSYVYTWYVCDASQVSGSALPANCVAATGTGAATATYTPVSGDLGKYLLAKVVATNGNGSVTAYSASTGAVTIGDQTIDITGSTGQIYTGSTLQLTATSTSGLTSFNWSSSDTSICTVGSTGLVTGVSNGHCVITATQPGNSDFASASATVDLMSSRGNQTITWPNMANTPFSASPIALAATVNSPLAISYASTTPAVCTVSGSNLTTLDLGTCSLTADQAGSPAFFAAPQASITFQIVQGSQTISMTGGNIELANGTYTIPGSTSSALTISYSTSSNASICTVTGSTLTMNGAGNCVVTATQAGNTYFQAATPVTATYRIVSTPTPDSSITISGSPTWGVSYPSTAGVWAGAGTVTVTTQWYACDNSGVSVSATGDLTANAPADCAAITGATSSSFTPTAAEVGKRLRVAEQASNVIGGTTNYYSVFTAASAAVVKQSQTITFAALSAATYGDAAITLAATSDRSKTVSYASSNTSVCTISGSTLTIVGAGSCDVTASQAGDASTLAAADVVRTLTVAKKAQTITLPAFTAGTYGDGAKSSGATTTSGLTITLTSADSTICSVSGLNVNIVAPGTCSITASQAGDSNYLAASPVTKTFTISKAAQTITFTGSTKQKPAGDFTLAATSTSGLTIAYTSTTLPVCTVSGSTVTPVGLGTCSITASQAGDSNYLAATSVTANFTIESVPVQTTPISIGAAANYRYGTAITATAGTWTGTATITYVRAWFRCDTAPSISAADGTATSLTPSDCVAISGATTTSYTPVAADIGKYLAIAETATNTTSTGTNNRTTFVATATAVEKQTQTITFAALATKVYQDAAFSLTASSNRSLTISYVSSNAAVCTVSGSTVTIVGGGTCDITASQAGDAVTLAATDVVRTLTVNKKTQTLAFVGITTKTYGDAALASGASASSGLTVTLTSADTSICSVTGLSINIVAPGTCSVTASQAGDNNYQAALSATQTFTIIKANQTITFVGSAKQKPAGDFTVAATTTSGLSISYASTTQSICTVSGSTVTPVALGTCTIAASQAGDSNYNAAVTVNANFTIESVPVETNPVSIASAANYRFGVALTATAGTWTGTATVTYARAWFRCDTAPSISSGNGTATSLKPADCTAISGATTLSYTPVAADLGKYLAIAETATNTTTGGTNNRTSFVSAATVVEKQTQTITFAALTAATFNDPAITLAATSDRSKTITYASSNTSVCTISGSTLTIVAAGSCDVTASQAGDTTTLAATDVVRTLTVNKSAQTITLPAFTAGTYGDSAKASGATTTSGLTITLTSADTSICTVSGLNVNIVTPGTCSITASQGGNSNYLAATDVTKSFTIAKAAQTITFTGSTKQKPAGDFTVAATTTSGLAITYTSTTQSICTVSGSTVTPVALGTCTISAAQAGDSNYLAATSVSANYTIESVPVQTTAVSIASAANYRFGVALTATAGTWTGTATVTYARAWFRCDTAPSISSGNGTATSLKPADCTSISLATGLTYTPVAADLGKYLAIAETATNTTTGGANNRTTFVSAATVVEKQTQTITFGALTAVTYGDANFTLAGTSNRSLTISYASSNTAVCSVSGSTVTIVAAGSCDITASQAGDTNTLAATSVTQTLTVNKKSQTVSLNALSAITYRGTPTTLVYSSTAGLAVSVASNDTSVCTVSGTTVSVVAVGTCSITASQAGNANYLAATDVTKTFLISKHQDTLTFAGGTRQFRSGNFTISASTLSGAAVSFASTTSSVCTVSGTTVTPLSHGDCVIAATAATDSNYIAPATVNATFVIERIPEQTTAHSMTSYSTYWYNQRIDYTAGVWAGSGTVTVSHTWYRCDSAPAQTLVAGNSVPAGCTALSESQLNAYTPVVADIGKYIAVAEVGSNVTSAGTNYKTSWKSASGVVTKWTQNLTFAALTAKTYGDIPFTLGATSDQGQPITYTSSNTSVCTISGAIVSIVAAGTCDITASQAGTATIAAATSITRTLTVNKADQTITFASLPDVAWSASIISIAPTSSSSLAVSSTSNDTAVCTLNSGVITLVKAGTCSITSAQAGNANYNAATSVTNTFVVSKATQTVTFNPPQYLGLQQHDGFTPSATADSGMDVSFSVGNTAVCAIQNGNIVPVAAGDCVITASQAGDDRYQAASDVHTVVVADYPVLDTFEPTGDLFTNGTSTSFTMTFASAITGLSAADLATVPAGACDIAEPVLTPSTISTYTVALSNCAEGNVGLKLAANTVSNGIPGPAADEFSTTNVGIDLAFQGGATITPAFTSPTNHTSLVYNVTFAEPVLGFASNDVTFAGSGSTDCSATVTGSGTDYVVTLDDCTDGTVRLSVNAGTVSDRAGNVGPAASASTPNATVDRVAPDSFDVTGLPDTYTRSTDLTIDFPIVAGNVYHCTLNGVELQGCDGNLVIPAGSLTSGDYTVEVWATDAAGNASTHFSHTFSVGAYAKPAAPVINAAAFDRTAFNHLTINWGVAVSQSAQLPVTGIKLEYSTDGSTWTAIPTLAADATSYDLAINSGKNYQFRARALSGPFEANASALSAVATYVAVYKPAITGISTSAALQKPVTGTVITLTGVDFRDFAEPTPASMAGTVVTVTDAAGKPTVATLVSVTGTTIRFNVPTTTKVGIATVKVTVGAGAFQRTSTVRNLNIVAKKVDQVITFTAPAGTQLGSPDTQLSAAMDSLSTPTFLIDPASIGICSVSTTGLVHPLKGGNCSFTISSPASDAFNVFTSTKYTVPVIRMNVDVAFALPQNLIAAFNSNNELPIGPATFQLTATPDANILNTVIKISSTPETTCFVDADLLLHIVGTGPCSVTALAENDYYRTSVPVVRNFNIARNDQTLTYVAPGTSLGLVVAPEATDNPSGFQLSASLSSGLTPIFESANAEICSVDATGIVIWNGDLVKNPTQVCAIKISHPGDTNFNPIPDSNITFTARHVPPLAPVGGWIHEPDGSLAVGRTGGLAANGGDGVAVVVVTGSKITITPFSRGLYIGPITAKITFPYYVPVKNVMTLKTQVCTVKFGITKKFKPGDPNAFKQKSFPNTKACAANKDAVAYFAQGNRLLPTLEIKRDRRWPTTYLAKTGGNGKGKPIYPAIKTWHLTIG